MSDLLPCPFCGSTEVELRKGMLFNGAVHCNCCSADVVFDAVRLLNEDGIYEETPWREAVTKGWNHRARSQEGEEE